MVLFAGIGEDYEDAANSLAGAKSMIDDLVPTTEGLPKGFDKQALTNASKSLDEKYLSKMSSFVPLPAIINT